MPEVEVVVKDGKAQLVSREGQLIAVPVEQAGRFIAEGARPADEAQVEKFGRDRKYSTLGQKAITAVEGAAEGATLGLSTAAAVELGGEDYREAALGRAEANPLTRGVAGVGGAIAGTLATGGVGGALAAPVRGSAALGRGAAGLVPSLGTGVLGRAGTAALRYGTQGAVEGAAFGLGSSLAESALEGVDWTADSALAGMRDGAFYGLVGGAALGGVGSLTGSAGKRVLESMTEGKGLKTAVQEFADGRILKGLSGNDARFWRAITRNGTQPERIQELAKRLRAWGVTEADDKAGLIAAKLQESGRQLDDVVQAIDDSVLPGTTVSSIDEVAALDRGDLVKYMPRPAREAALAHEERLRQATADMDPRQLEAAKAFSWGYDDTIRQIQRGVPDDEIVAARAKRYGGDVDKRGESHREHIRKAKQYAKDVEEYIANGPKADDQPIVYRGMVGGDDLHERFLKRGEFDLRGQTTSTSYDPQVGRSFVSRYHDETNPATRKGVLLKLKHRSGVGIGHIAEKSVEREVLLPGKTRFRITARHLDPDNPNRLIVEAEEMPARMPRPNLGAMGDEIGAQLERLRASGVASDARIARQVERQIEPFFAKFGPDTGNVPTFKDLRTFKSRLGKAQSWHNQQRTAAAEEMQRLYGIVARNLDDAAEEAGPELAAAWKQANRDADDLRTLADSIKRKSVADLKNRYISPSDYGTAVPAGIVMSMITGSPLAGAITTAVGSVAHKMLRERGSMAIGRLANWAVETEQRTRAAARVIAGLEKAKELPVRAFAKATSRAEIEKQYKDIKENVGRLDSNPDAVADKIAKVVQPIADEQPEVAMAMSRQLYDDLAWLKTKLPQEYGRGTMSLTPSLELSRAKPSEMKKLVSYAAALADPISVLEDFAEGNLDWHGIEALKERRPERYEAIREQVMAACAEAGRTLSYPKRVMLGVAFEFVSDPSLLHTADLQATWEARDAVPPTGGPRGPGRPPKQGADFAGMTETPFQKALSQ